MEAKKKLQRINEDKVFTGVCNGLSEYFNIEVQTVRILYVVASLIWALPILIYIVLSFTLPIKEIEIAKAEKVFNGTKVNFIDTPGIYSISDRSEEEKVTEKALFEEEVDGVIIIADATSLERNIYILYF